MKKPLVSILIPFKNAVPYFTPCIKSIIGQKYENWEIMAVNDHSTDESLSIIEGFAAKDSRIKVLQNQGTGIIQALRLGYAHSTGNLISRMDADDLMEPHKIGSMVESLKIYGKGYIALGLIKYFSEDGIGTGYARYETWLNSLTTLGTNYSEIYKECVIPSPCWMVYREDLDTCGAFLSNTYPEDYDLTFRFYENKIKCIPSDKQLHQWRDYANRTSRTSEVYTANYFLDIKLSYFLKLDYNSHRPLVIWGAGAKGKVIAQKLIAQKLAFYWLCDNPNKIGKDIYGKEMLHYTVLETLDKPQSIITVANTNEQQKIRNYLKKLQHIPMTDYFFFC